MPLEQQPRRSPLAATNCVCKSEKDSGMFSINKSKICVSKYIASMMSWIQETSNSDVKSPCRLPDLFPHLRLFVLLAAQHKEPFY